MIELIPVQASEFARTVDPLFYALTIISFFATVGIFLAVVFMAAKYRYKPGEDRPSHALESPLLEITWTVIPAIVFLGFFAWGAVVYHDYLDTPEDALQVDVVAKQWMWKLQHESGRREVNELHMPVNTVLELTLTSQDVLHDFYVPAFRKKVDVLPGRFSKLWLEATKTGTFHLFCAEYCGTEHSYMIGTVTVMTEEAYAEWARGDVSAKPPLEVGRVLFQDYGCAACHGDRNAEAGPALGGLFGSAIELPDGVTIEADDEYLRAAVLNPALHVAKGYTPLMPSYQGQMGESDLMNIITYIKSLPPQPDSNATEPLETERAPNQ